MATANPFVLKERRRKKTSRKFVTSPDILVAKRKNSVADATVLVAISSPAIVGKQSLDMRTSLPVCTSCH